MRKILFITGIRSDFYIQLPILREAKKDKSVRSVLVVAGAHLEKKFGYTIKNIKKLNIKINYKIKNLVTQYDDEIGRLISFNRQIKELTKIVKKEKPDIIVSPFDREEALSTSIIGTYMNIPVAHLGAGDHTKFNVDGIVRQAVSKLSTILFCSNKYSEKKLLEIGEQKKRIFNYGSTSFERYSSIEKINLNKLEKKTKVKLKNGLILSIFHPVSGYTDEAFKEAKNLISALDKFNKPTIFILPNSDPGNLRIRNYIIKFKPKFNKNLKIFNNIDEKYFVNLLRNCNLIIGNSSMGVYESSYFGIHALNIGRRQKGRASNKNVHFIKGEKREILLNLQKYYGLKRFAKIKDIFYQRNSSKRILNKLKNIKLDKKILDKNYEL